MVVSEKNFTILAESYALSPRQREIARLMLNGTIRHYELAEAMGMSHGNLAKHLLRMSNKMHCRGRAEILWRFCHDGLTLTK